MTKKQRLKKKLDKLIQEIYTKKYPKCMVCHAPTSEMHHYYPKAQSLRLRYEPDNLCPLCRSCHFSHHTKGNPIIHEVILKKRGEKWRQKLREKKNEVFKDTLSNLREIEQKLEEK